MEKNYGKYMLYGLLVLVIVGLILAFTGFSFDMVSLNVNKAAVKTPSLDKSTFSPVETGTTGSGDVSIELEPRQVINGELKVDIAVNTHSVDLSPFNLKQITTLEYNGKLIKPVSAPNLGGHHSNGELVFEVGEDIDSFKIRIKGIPKVEERIFEW